MAEEVYKVQHVDGRQRQADEDRRRDVGHEGDGDRQQLVAGGSAQPQRPLGAVQDQGPTGNGPAVSVCG